MLIAGTVVVLELEIVVVEVTDAFKPIEVLKPTLVPMLLLTPLVTVVGSIVVCGDGCNNVTFW
jgi:hypothetical protein